MKKHILISALSLASLLTVPAHAESNYATNASTATAKLDFQIVIPKVLYLRIGSGTDNAVNAAVDMLTFTVPAANIGNGTPVAATGGDIVGAPDSVTVRAYGNGGNPITLNSNVGGALSDGAGDTIPWSQITVTPGALAAATPGYTNAAIAHPAFSATSGNGTATTLTAGAAKVARVEGKWTFAYANTGFVPAGTYGATGANNGRVTYTIAQP